MGTPGSALGPALGLSDTNSRAGRPCYEKRHIVTSQVEHSSVLNYCLALENSKTPLLAQEGAGGGPVRVTYLPVDRDGLLKLADLEAAITDQTAVVSLMWANRIGVRC